MSRASSASQRFKEISQTLGLRSGTILVQEGFSSEGSDMLTRTMPGGKLPSYSPKASSTVSPVNRQLTSFITGTASLGNLHDSNQSSAAKSRQLNSAFGGHDKRMRTLGVPPPAPIMCKASSPVDNVASNAQNQARLQSLFKRLNNLSQPAPADDSRDKLGKEKLDQALSELEDIVRNQEQVSRESLAFFKEEGEAMLEKVEKERKLREAEDEALSKMMKNFESEAKFRVTKCKNVRYLTHLLGVDAEGQGERRAQAD